MKCVCASAIRFNSADYAGDTSAIASTTALRDSAGDLHANFPEELQHKHNMLILQKIMKQANIYPIGTVVAVGGDKEVPPAK